MSTEDKYVTINGFVSTIKKDGEFDGVQFRVGRELFKDLDNVSKKMRLPEDYKSKFGSLKKLGLEVPDSVLDYRVELTTDSLNIFGLSETTVRCAFAIFLREHVKNKKMMMLTEKILTFRVRDVVEAPTEEVVGDDVDFGSMFGEELGDY